MSKMLSTTPTASPQGPRADEDDVGTLSQRAARSESRRSRGKTRFDVLADRVAEIRGNRRLGLTIQSSGRSMTDCLGDVSLFSELIDDRVVNFEQLTATRGAGGGPVTVLCSNPPSPAKSHPADVVEELRVLEMRPTRSFMQSVARYANEHTHIRGLTGTFLRTMADAQSEVAKSMAVDLLNHIFSELEKKHVVRGRRSGDKSEKPVLLRTLRRDTRPASTRRWPATRSCRALLHSGYRDDVSHMWLVRVLADLVPSGTVVRYGFDGDLLRGAILVPELARTEEDSDYSGGVFFFSGEVGNRRCGIMPFVYRSLSRAITLVGDVWGITHSGKVSVDTLESKLRGCVHKNLPLVTTAIDRLLDSQSIVFSESDRFAVERIIIALRTSTGLSQQDIRLWRVGVMAERNMLPGLALSVFTIQNGLTRMSQVVDDAVRQIQIDTTAGRLLDMDWEKIADRAATISDEQVREAFPELQEIDDDG